MKKTVIITLVLAIIVLVITGCTTAVKNINDNPENYIGQSVKITGKAVAPIKFGSLEGFTLQGDDASILVYSKRLPKHGDSVTVSGKVKKGALIGTYVEADQVSFND